MTGSSDNSATWHRVAALDELADDSVKSVTAGDRQIALTRFEGKYGALAPTCPHAGGPLGEGCIEYGALVCPWHGHEFHPLTGEGIAYAERVAVYPVEVRDDGIYVRV
ncbi:MAG: Rieske (2Fe-2S) protein [Pseudomonadota bacterium]